MIVDSKWNNSFPQGQEALNYSGAVNEEEEEALIRSKVDIFKWSLR